VAAQTSALNVSDAYLDRYSTTSVGFSHFTNSTQPPFPKYLHIIQTIIMLQYCSHYGTAEFGEV
jgi:hypothetical protein